MSAPVNPLVAWSPDHANGTTTGLPIQDEDEDFRSTIAAGSGSPAITSRRCPSSVLETVREVAFDRGIGFQPVIFSRCFAGCKPTPRTFTDSLLQFVDRFDDKFPHLPSADARSAGGDVLRAMASRQHLVNRRFDHSGFAFEL